MVRLSRVNKGANDEWPFLFCIHSPSDKIKIPKDTQPAKNIYILYSEQKDCMGLMFKNQVE